MQHDDLNQIFFKILSFCSKDGSKRPIAHMNDDAIELIVNQATKIMEKDDVVLHLTGNFVVVGDIHGNIDSLLEIFQKVGYPPYKSYVFLGDYIDRGQYSLEVVVLLLALKIKYPTSLYLLRGNHEISLSSSFRFECQTYINDTIYMQFEDCFNQFPLVALINGDYLCQHGGISKKAQDFSQYSSLKKSSKVKGMALDILWSDPTTEISCFGPITRGRSRSFGNSALESFLKKSGIKGLIRGHSYVEQGVKQDFLGCTTVFSSTDYLGKGNTSAVLLVNYSGISNVLFAPNPQARKNAFPIWLLEETCESIRVPVPLDVTFSDIFAL